jgi:hypothetical protein
MNADWLGADRCPAVAILSGHGTHVRLMAQPGNGLRYSAARSPSSGRSADPHARIFALSLAAAVVARLVLNAVSPMTRVCQLPAPDFGATSADSVSASLPTILSREEGWHVPSSDAIRSKHCATNEGEEPGY